MHSLSLILAVFVSATTEPPQPPAGAKPQSVPFQSVRAGLGAKQDCPGNPEVRMGDSASEAEFSRLGELPPGALSLAVVREVDGCAQPVVVRYGYGAVRSKDDESAPPKRPRAVLRR